MQLVCTVLQCDVAMLSLHGSSQVSLLLPSCHPCSMTALAMLCCMLPHLNATFVQQTEQYSHARLLR